MLRMISQFKRITGRVDAPVFGYAAIPSTDLLSPTENLNRLPYDTDLPEINLLIFLQKFLGETDVASGGSRLWEVPD